LARSLLYFAVATWLGQSDCQQYIRKRRWEEKMTTNVRVRLRRKIEKLNSQLLTLGAQVEESVHLAVKAIDRRDAQMAAKVIDGDLEIDRKEVDLEEECLEILALHQPVAIDLRHIIAVLKINKDLERAGDLAVNIAETAIDISGRLKLAVPKDYFIMARQTQSMLKKSLDAFVSMSVEAAYEVLAEDDEVDRKKHTLHRQFEGRLLEEPGLIQPLIHLFLVSRHLERIADLATNIAEEVIYMVTGEIIRHGRKTLAAAEGAPEQVNTVFPVKVPSGSKG
jgi:phosphate transport system protein